METGECHSDFSAPTVVSNSFSLRYSICLVAQPCPTLWDPMECSPPGSSVHGDSPGKRTGVSCHAFLQGIFLTQRLNSGLQHCRWILYRLSHQGSPFNMPRHHILGQHALNPVIILCTTQKLEHHRYIGYSKSFLLTLHKQNHTKEGNKAKMIPAFPFNVTLKHCLTILSRIILFSKRSLNVLINYQRLRLYKVNL